jgi:tetratricopeptide (TPR) repeat protein
MLGYPAAALGDVDQVLADGREIEQATTIMYALIHAALVQLLCGHYEAADALAEEAIALAEEKGALIWKGAGILDQGSVSALIGKPSEAIENIIAGMDILRSTGATLWIPLHLVHLAKANLELGQYKEAWHNIRQAVTATEGR